MGSVGAARAMPNICLQMLLRGANTVGYTPYPTKVTTAFVAEATDVGIDIFRIFDALNNIEQMRPAIDAVRETGTAVAEVAMSYTGDLRTRPKSCTRSTTICGWPSRSSMPARTFLRSRTWPGCCARRRPPLWCRRCAGVRPAGARAHPRHPGGQLATYLAAWQAGPVPSTAPAPRCPARPVSLRCRRSSPLPRTPNMIPAWTWARCAISNRTGRPCARYAPFESVYRPHRACTPTRSPAVSCPTCASRRSRARAG